jgi:hypothetical protein
MRNAAERQIHAQAVGQVGEYMRKHRLSLADLIDVGGEDLRSADPGVAGKARAVSRCWELMARLQVTHIDLETALPRPRPGLRVRRRSNGKPNQKAQQNQRDDLKSAWEEESIQINDLAVSSPISAPALQSDEKAEGDAVVRISVSAAASNFKP